MIIELMPFGKDSNLDSGFRLLDKTFPLLIK